MLFKRFDKFILLLAIPSIFSFSYIALKFKKFSKVKNLIFTAILFTAIINFSGFLLDGTLL